MTLSSVASGTTAELEDVMGADATHVWAIGENGTIRFWNGSTWSPQNSGTTRYLSQLWVASRTDVWIVGERGTVLRHR